MNNKKSVISKDVNGLNKMMGKSVFLKIFGDSPVNRVLDFLIVFDRFDYSIADISENSVVGYSTLKILIRDLVKRKIVVQTRVSGKCKMYKLNRENSIVEKFVEFYWGITSQKVKEIISPIPA